MLSSRFAECDGDQHLSLPGGSDVAGIAEVWCQGVPRVCLSLADIQDADFRDKVVEAHALALSETEFERASRKCAPGQLRHAGNAARHAGRPLRVAWRAWPWPSPMDWKRSWGRSASTGDVLLAGGLCHDVGKPYEFSPRNIARWQAEPGAAGFPSVRHPGYGVHLALTVGLPEAIVHIVGAHSMHAEGSTCSRVWRMSSSNTLTMPSGRSWNAQT